MSNIIKITILIFIIQIKLHAQNKDNNASDFNNTLLPNVDINAHLDTAKYLWNLLKENYDLFKDTSLYYDFYYKTANSDSSYEEFTGVIYEVSQNKKIQIYLCSGSYKEKKSQKPNSNIIDFFSISKKSGFISFRKFKRRTKFVLDDYNQWFSLEYKKRNRYSKSKYSFNNRRIKSLEENIHYKSKLLGLSLNMYSFLKYRNLQNTNITDSIYANGIVKRKIDSTYNKFKFIFKVKNTQTKCKRILLSNETPHSMYKKLLLYDMKKEESISP